jgi:hypothetical protein
VRPISELLNPILSSFYLLTLFDQVRRENQRKLHNGFYNGYKFIVESASTIYDISNNLEFSNLYLPNDFINELTGETTLYFTLSFFNGKTGNLHLFYNEDLSGTTTESRNYFQLLLNPTGKTFTWDTSIKAIEIINTGYTESVNETIDKFQNQKPVFPTKNAISGNTYIQI